MAKYETTIRNSRQTVLRDAFRSGTLYLCSGALPGSLAIPGSGIILSQHSIDAAAGTVATGKLTLSDADVAEDASANNSGTVTFAVFANSGGSAVAMYAVPSQMSLQVNGGASLVITSGVAVDVDSLEVIEGNA